MNRNDRVVAELPAGEYYVGDLCYVMHQEWDEFCALTIKGEECLNGEFDLADGRKFFFGQTAYGDGEYQDDKGNSYCVDAGLIGIIAVKDISENDLKNLDSGHVHTFDQPFFVSAEAGIFYFGNVRIDTAYEEEDWDEYYADNEEFEYED